MSDAMEKIKNVDDESDIKSEVVDTGLKTPTPKVDSDQERFGNLLKGGGTLEIAPKPEKVGRTTLMDVVQELNQHPTVKAEISPESLIAQTKRASTRIDEIKETLEAPNIGIRSPTHIKLLENKLIHIHDNLKIALTKVGSEFSPEAAASIENTQTRTNPVERFLSFLSDGQSQLDHLGDELERMSINKKEMAPVAMLAVQVKVGQIQQELELFSNLLNQALQSIKTVMNIQV